jgi:hypothetical protein
MRNVTAVVTGLVLAFSLAVSAAAQDSKKPPVRAKEPTVVTVEGKAEEVSPDKSRREQPGGPLGQSVRSVGRGAAWVGRRIVGWFDFNFDGEQVVPSERERKEKEKASRK